jgi:hypothetical protein
LTPRHRIEHFAILGAAAIGIAVSAGKSLSELRKAGDDQTIIASPLAAPVDSSARPQHPDKIMKPTRATGNLAAALACLGLVLASGWMAASMLLGQSMRGDGRTLAAGLSVPLGFALHSTAAFGLMLAGRLDRGSLLASVPVVTIVVGACWWMWRSGPRPSLQRMQQPTTRVFRDLLIVLAIILVCSAGAMLKRLGGDWDALYFWNARAASILVAGHDWRWAYDGTIDAAYNDYPLCLPLSIATIWSYGGQMTLVVPAAISLLSLLSVATILYAGIALLSDDDSVAGASLNRPVMGALIFVSLPALYRMVAGQRADLLLMSAMLGSLVAFMLALGTREARHLALAIGLATCSAWIKNEGAAFLALCLIGCAVIMRIRKFNIGSVVLWSGISAGPLIVALIALKLRVAWANDLWTYAAATQPAEASLTQRALMILTSMSSRMAGYLYLPYLVVIVLVLARARQAWRNAPPVVIAIVGMMIAYFGVYLATPRDLEWHLDHSEKRLLAHLWPMWVLLLYQVLGRRDDSIDVSSQAARG